jgi:hypothetical protein
MQRWISGRLYARLVSLHRAACILIFAQGKTAGTSASPILIYAVIVLLLILAVLEIDLHREELKALGLAGSEEGGWSPLVGP